MIGPTTKTASRDPEELIQLGPFMLQCLMKETCARLGIGFDEEQRARFLRATMPHRAEVVARYLRIWDGAREIERAQEARSHLH